MVKKLLMAVFCVLLMSPCVYADRKLPKLYLFFGPDQARHLEDYRSMLSHPAVAGAQIIYTWNTLETRKGVYDFAQIRKDLHFLQSIRKKLFIQLQDRSFQPDAYFVPDYIRQEREYHGGVAMQYDFPGEGKPMTAGWVARVWDPAVRERFQLLFAALAAEFDGKIAGINLPETAVDFDPANLPQGFTNEKYFAAELANIAALRQSFHHGVVLQYVNFFPGEWNNDHQYMSRLFKFAREHDIGIGGPDVVPYRKNHMKNSYPFLHRDGERLTVVAMAVQEPDYTYRNPATNEFYTFADFYSFSRDYLHASILFWNTEEPFFTTQLLPALESNFERNKYSS